MQVISEEPHKVKGTSKTKDSGQFPHLNDGVSSTGKSRYSQASDMRGKD